MKKFTVLALLGASFAVQTANAVEKGIYYTTVAPPAKSNITITLSGECSGKVVKPVTSVYYQSTFQHTGGVIERGGSEANFDLYTNDGDVDVSGNNDGWTAQDKHTETLKNGKLSVKATYKSTAVADSDIWGLDSGAYDSEITCKNGQTLSQFLVGFGPYINRDASNFKTQASLMHTHNTDNPAVGEYKIKFTSSGVLEQRSECKVKGDLLSAEYSVTCTQPKAIKVKVVASAAGESVPN